MPPFLHGSQYVTNQWCTAPSMWLTHQLEQDVGGKVLHFINNENQETLGYKTLSIWYVSKLITIMNPNIMSHFIFWSIRKKKRYDVELVQLGSLTKSLIPIMEFIQISLLYFYVSVNLMIKLLIKIINPGILNLQRIKSYVRFHKQNKKTHGRIPFKCNKFNYQGWV